MNADDRLELIAKIRKLMDRARRDAGAEARSARNLARTLMREHGITAAELEITDAPHVHFERSGPPPKRTPVKIKLGDLEVRFKL